MSTSVTVTLESFMAAYTAAKRDEQRQAALAAGLRALTCPLGQHEPLLTLVEIARHYHVNYTTAWRWGLPWVEQRGNKRYLVSQCDSYFQSDAFKQRRLALRELRCQNAGNKGSQSAGRPKEGTAKPRVSTSR
jgi:hypothetical protein